MGYEKDIFKNFLMDLNSRVPITPKACVADLDARRFAMMGVAIDRYLPGRNAMLATKPM